MTNNAPPVPPGQCGDLSPRLPDAAPTRCELPHGHAGNHHSEEAAWQPVNSVLEAEMRRLVKQHGARAVTAAAERQTKEQR